LVLYEVNVAELGGDIERTRDLMAYLSDLGVNAIEVMPLPNVAASVDWGYLPIGYFGVDERFGKRSDFQRLSMQPISRALPSSSTPSTDIRGSTSLTSMSGRVPPACG